MRDGRLPSLFPRAHPLCHPSHHRHRQLIINKKYEWVSNSSLPSEHHAIQRFVHMSLNPKKAILKAVTAPSEHPEHPQPSQHSQHSEQAQQSYQYRKVLIINHKPTHRISGGTPTKRQIDHTLQQLRKNRKTHLSIKKSQLHLQHPIRNHGRSLRDLNQPRNRSCNVSMSSGGKVKREDFELKPWRYEESDKENEELMVGDRSKVEEGFALMSKNCRNGYY